MRFQVVVVRDSAANVFNSPYCVPHIGTAVRGFTDEINRASEDNMLYKHPEDFELHQLGEYNDEDGTFECGPPRLLVRGKDVKKG